MYLVPLKTLLVEAVKRTFDSDYPEADFRGIHTSIEFPEKKQHYPGIWVDFSPTAQLRVAGVAHAEYESEGGLGRKFTRWRFGGEASFTVVALTSLERDRLYDEIVRTMAFGPEQAGTSDFRDYIQNNEYLAVQFDFDAIISRGFAQTTGTPWQTNEMIYEAEIAMECFGEFVADPETATLAPLTQVNVYPYYEGQDDDPQTAGVQIDGLAIPQGGTPTMEDDDGLGAWQ